MSDSITIAALFAAVCAVESGGNPRAVNEAENAVGIAQIRPVMVRECNRILRREEFTLVDRLSPARSREMFMVFTSHYSDFRKDLGLRVDAEVLARYWNAGPSRWQCKGAEVYWAKVRAWF